MKVPARALVLVGASQDVLVNARALVSDVKALALHAQINALLRVQWDVVHIVH